MTNKPKISFLNRVLDLHFAYTDEIVDCDIVKRFLPILADQDLSISIPTPITVHLEHCPQCQKDLRYLVSLDLRKDQLYVLSQIFTEVSDDTKVIRDDLDTECVLFAAMDFTLISKDTLKEICLSKTHRQKVFEVRSEILNNIEKTDQSVCKIPYCNLFEACFPYSNTPLDIPNLSIMDVIHMKSCPQCLSNLQMLLQKIGEICDRKNSGISTRLSLKKDVEKEYLASTGYEDWPVDVEMFYCKPEKEKPSPKHSNQKNIKSNSFVVKYAKPISVAAAILLICSLFFNNRSAYAISLKDILIALDNVRSIRITKYSPHQETPDQVILMSRTRNVRILQGNDMTVVFDLNSGLRSIHQNSTNETTISKMNQELQNRVNSKLTGNWGTIPRDLTDSFWQEVTTQMDQVLSNLEVYELSYQDKLEDEVTWIKRVWVDIRTNLPHNIEVYSKTTNNPKLTLMNTFQFDYLTTEKDITLLLTNLEN